MIAHQPPGFPLDSGATLMRHDGAPVRREDAGDHGAAAAVLTAANRARLSAAANALTCAEDAVARALATGDDAEIAAAIDHARSALIYLVATR